MTVKKRSPSKSKLQVNRKRKAPATRRSGSRSNGRLEHTEQRADLLARVYELILSWPLEQEATTTADAADHDILVGTDRNLRKGGDDEGSKLTTE